MKIFNFTFNTNKSLLKIKIVQVKSPATNAEDSSLMESFYNCGVYYKGNNLENNNCHNNHAKIEDWFTSLH